MSLLERQSPGVAMTPDHIRTRKLPLLVNLAVAAAALALAAVVVLVPGIGGRVLIVVLGVAFYLVGLFAAATRVEGRRSARNRIWKTLIYSACILAILPLASVVWTLVSKGVVRLDGNFFGTSMNNIGARDPNGGAYHAIVGTLEQVGIATLIAVPLGVLGAIYLVEYGRGRFAFTVRFFVDVMTGIPSIVAGLFAFALFALFFGPGVRLGFAGAVALSVLMIPVVVRATEEMLKIVPNELREAAYALGTPKWRTIVKVVIPTSIAGIASGITLAIARVIGETAPLLIIAGLTTSLNFNPFSGRMATLPVFAYTSYAAPGVPREPYLDRAWTAALVLIIIVLALNLLARIIARVFAPKTR